MSEIKKIITSESELWDLFDKHKVKIYGASSEVDEALTSDEFYELVEVLKRANGLAPLKNP